MRLWNLLVEDSAPCADRGVLTVLLRDIVRVPDGKGESRILCPPCRLQTVLVIQPILYARELPRPSGQLHVPRHPRSM